MQKVEHIVLVNGVSEAEVVSGIVCNSCSVSSAVKGSVTGEHCSVAYFSRENNLVVYGYDRVGNKIVHCVVVSI